MKYLRFVISAIVILGVIFLAPMTANAALFTGYTSGVAVQNLDPNQAAATLTFYNPDGSVRDTVNVNIPGHALQNYVTLPLTTSDPFNGSLVVSSDKPLGVVSNVSADNNRVRGSYDGTGNGSTTVYLPFLNRNNGNNKWTSFFSVQNAGSSDAHVIVTYPDACGARPSVTIKAGASVVFDQGSAAEACHNQVLFSATVTSDQPIVAVAFTESTVKEALSTYTAFGSGDANLKIPMVNVQPTRTLATGIQLFDVGTADTTVKLTYLDADGVKTCTETQTITHGTAANFALKAFATGGAGITTNCTGLTLVGTAYIAQAADNSANMPLVAIINQTRYTPTYNESGAYSSFSPSQGTPQVNFPLIMDRNGKRLWKTGITVMNVGTSPINVRCTFTNTAYHVDKTLAANQALNDVQGTKIAPNYVGAGSCTAYTDLTYTTVNASAKLVGMVNQDSTPPLPGESDTLLSYEAINSTP